MSDENRQLVTEYLNRILAHDIDGASKYFADDLKGHALGRSKLAGDHDKARMLQVLTDYLTGRQVTAEPLDILTSDTHVAAVVRNHVSHAEGTYNGLRVVLYRVADGKIQELWVFDEDQRAFDAAIDND